MVMARVVIIMAMVIMMVMTAMAVVVVALGVIHVVVKMNETIGFYSVARGLISDRLAAHQ